MPMLPNAFSPLLEGLINKTFGDAYEQHPEQYPQIVTSVEYSDSAFEEYGELNPLGPMPEKSVGSAFTEVSVSMGYKPRFDHKAYGSQFVVAHELVRDEKYNFINACIKMQAKSARYTQEIAAGNLYNRAFNSSYTQSGYDGKELCSTAHPTAAANQSNMASVASALNEESLRQAFVDISNYKDSSGNKAYIKPKRLIYPPALRSAAYKVVESSQEPDTANNAKNPYAGAVDRFEAVYLDASETAWFLLTDAADGVHFVWRERMLSGFSNDPESLNALYYAYQRFSTGWRNFRAVYGNAGL